MGIQNSTVTLQINLAVSCKAKYTLTIDLVIMLPGVYPKELKTYAHAKTYTHMFIVSLFIIAETWKQPRCPSEGAWINKLWSIQWNIIWR